MAREGKKEDTSSFVVKRESKIHIALPLEFVDEKDKDSLSSVMLCVV